MQTVAETSDSIGGIKNEMLHVPACWCRRRTWQNRFMIWRDCGAANYAQLIANGSHLPDISSLQPQRLRASSPLCLGWWQQKWSQAGSDRHRQEVSLCIQCSHTSQPTKLERHKLSLGLGEGTTVGYGCCKNQKDFYTSQTELIAMGTMQTPCWKVCQHCV